MGCSIIVARVGTVTTALRSGPAGTLLTLTLTPLTMGGWRTAADPSSKTDHVILLGRSFRILIISPANL